MTTIDNNIDSKLLQYILSQDIINLDDMRNNMKKEERNQILSQHQYKIFQDKDGRWKTTLPDPTKKRGRKLIAKADKNILEDEIVAYYKELNERPSGENLTLRDIYPLWLQSRKHEVKSLMTAKKNDQDWKRYYLDDPIIDKPMNKITVQELKDWAHKKIDKYQFNKRDYYNMAVVIKKCFKFAKDSEFIERNTWAEVEINTDKLRKDRKKDSKKEVYYLDEQQALIQYSFDMFNKNPRNIGALSIPFLFVTGLRIGELGALKYEDLDYQNDVINVSRSESVIYSLDDKGNFKYVTREVTDETKTDAGERSVPFVPYAKQIIDMIKDASESFGFYDDGFIFCPNSRRVSEVSIDKRLYNYCNAISVDKKSAHKIRKTFISRLIHSGKIDIDTICRVVGHVDMKTTFTSYCFSLDHQNEIQSKFSEVLDA